MHAALIIDEERLTHEHAMLRRLCVGLLGHGIRLTRLVPETLESELASESEEQIALANRMRVAMRGFPWTRKARADRIADKLQSQRAGVPDVFYAIGQYSWPLALDLAELLDRPVAINIWSEKLIRFVPYRDRTNRIASYIAASEPIAERLRSRVDPSMVTLVPMGAPPHKESRTIFTHYPEAVQFAVLGACDDTAAYDAMLAGLAHVIQAGDAPGVHVAMELCGRRCHDVWRIARRYELLGAIAALDDAAQHRDLVIQSDVILLPERRGAMTSLLLEAMACGAVVIAREDPFLDVVRDGQSGLTVQEDDSAAWAEHLRTVLYDPALARQMGQEGRRLVAQLHGSAQQVRLLAEALTWIVGPDPKDYRFQEQAAGSAAASSP